MRKKILIVVAICVVVLVIAGASSDKKIEPPQTVKKSGVASGGTASETTQQNPAQNNGTCFVASKQNPILRNGSLFGGSNWNDPSVLATDSGYVMYASASKNFDENIKIYRLTSSNGADWQLSPETAVFEKSTSGWDSKSTETPSVALFRGTYYLFYTGYDTKYNDISSFKVGYATSADGIHWERAAQPLIVPSNPKGAPDLSFNQFVVGEPGAVVFNDTLYVYFTAIGANTSVGNTLQTIGMIKTSDGKNWSKPVQVLTPDQKTYPRADGWIGYSTPSAAVVDGKVHLYVDVANEKPKWHQVALREAISSNGSTGWSLSVPIFSRTDFSWTSDEIGAPSAVAVGSKILLWFAGNSNNNLGIGLATCDTTQ